MFFSWSTYLHSCRVLAKCHMGSDTIFDFYDFSFRDVIYIYIVILIYLTCVTSLDVPRQVAECSPRFVTFLNLGYTQF